MHVFYNNENCLLDINKYINSNLSHSTSPPFYFIIIPSPSVITINPVDNYIVSFKEYFQYFIVVWNITVNRPDINWIFYHGVIDNFKKVPIIIVGNIDA